MCQQKKTAWSTKCNPDKLNFIKKVLSVFYGGFCLKDRKGTTQWEKIFSDHVFDKRFACKGHKTP